MAHPSLYNVLVRFVLTSTPINPETYPRIEASSQLKDESIATIVWAKKIENRKAQQKNSPCHCLLQNQGGCKSSGPKRPLNGGKMGVRTLRPKRPTTMHEVSAIWPHSQGMQVGKRHMRKVQQEPPHQQMPGDSQEPLLCGL